MAPSSSSRPKSSFVPINLGRKPAVPKSALALCWADSARLGVGHVAGERLGRPEVAQSGTNSVSRNCECVNTGIRSTPRRSGLEKGEPVNAEVSLRWQSGVITLIFATYRVSALIQAEMQHSVAAVYRRGVNEPCPLGRFSGPFNPQASKNSLSILATTIMPHATADEGTSLAGTSANENILTYTYLSLIACNGQFDLPFVQGNYFMDNDSTIWNEPDAQLRPYPMPSSGKQAWALYQDAIGTMAVWLSHLGSQFDGML